MAKCGCEPLTSRLDTLFNWKNKKHVEFTSGGMETKGARVSAVNITAGDTCTQPIDRSVQHPSQIDG